LVLATSGCATTYLPTCHIDRFPKLLPTPSNVMR